jgi:hypothetical protein
MTTASKLWLLTILLTLASVVSAPAIARPPAPAATHSQHLPIIIGDRGDSANEFVPPYTGQFQYGLNGGYYGNGWDDKGIYRLCFDAGCRSSRNSLPDRFIGQWGATIRVSEFAYAANDLQFKEITTFLGEPRPEWQDTASYYRNSQGQNERSLLWQGMYEPIWDDGANGTPVNDQNRFALYVWTIAHTYGDHIKFYEIINEPDYTFSAAAYAERTQVNSWWNRAPTPDELPNLKAPIYNYIRLLRIAYAVIKGEQPNAYITPGGIGYSSFLDALLRYTDNPDGGKVTPAYPLTGGAYFDALSFHCYPQFGARHWDGQKWVPDRHSDKAVEVLIESKNDHETTLAARGYNGTLYPKKPLIVTEMNVARKSINNYIGGIEVQRNFTIKALVKSQQIGIKQVYWFVTGEASNYSSETQNEFNLMGFYENLKRDKPGQQKLTGQGIANRTTFQQLYSWTYDAAATGALHLPATIDGAAFRQGALLRYVLWARTTIDMSESAGATISLPGSYTAVAWDGTQQTIGGSNIALSGAPIFLTPQP